MEYPFTQQKQTIPPSGKRLLVCTQTLSKKDLSPYQKNRTYSFGRAGLFWNVLFFYAPTGSQA